MNLILDTMKHVITSYSIHYTKLYDTEDGTFNNGAGGIDNWDANRLVSETFMTFDKTFNEIHKINAVAGS